MPSAMRAGWALLATGMLVIAGAAEGTSTSREEVQRAVERRDYERLRDLGSDGMRRLAEIYREAPTSLRIEIARTWYALGIESEDAKSVLFEDLGTSDPSLRLEVQWAIGRVSSDPEVVRRLLATMRDDASPLYRDKAACALAYDQIHLRPEERLAQFEGLVAALDDEKPQVRAISIKALRILTGQTKGFRPQASAAERDAAVERWRRWIDEYRASL